MIFSCQPDNFDNPDVMVTLVNMLLRKKLDFWLLFMLSRISMHSMFLIGHKDINYLTIYGTEVQQSKVRSVYLKGQNWP